MTSNGRIHKHRAATIWHFVLDFLILCLAFVLGTRLRFSEDWLGQMILYAPGVLAGAASLVVMLYIAGFYSPRFIVERSSVRLYLLLGVLYLAATIVMLAIFYVNFSTRVGRGVMAMSWPMGALFLFAHHWWILRSDRGRRERVAFLINDAHDTAELAIFKNINHTPFETIGVIATDESIASALPHLPYLGSMLDARGIIERHRVDRVVCSSKCLRDPVLRPGLCQMRYSGVVVSSFLSLCEEEFQLAPLEFVTADWLLMASDSPRLMYIKKMKRGFDIVAAMACLGVLWPFLLLGMVLVKVTSQGPVFFRQVRTGRFGAPFKVIKLRTMRVDAESDGPQWSGELDTRLTPAGRFLRNYRIDEIPQLMNVLRGQMSFVGPRPERPEFVEQLRERIPWYLERLLIQPGLTGWAQVSYPYGASIEDSARKLEYDLYYMKHMGLYLDLAILLDTVRTILTGGGRQALLLNDPLKRDLTRYDGEALALSHEAAVSSRM